MITTTYNVKGSIQLVNPQMNAVIELNAGDAFKIEEADDGTTSLLHKEKTYYFNEIHSRAIENVIARYPQIFEKTWVEDDMDDDANDLDIHWSYKLAELIVRLNRDGVEVVSASAAPASREEEHYQFSIKVNGLLNNLIFDEYYTDENYKHLLAHVATVLLRNNEPGSPEWLRGRDLLNRV